MPTAPSAIEERTTHIRGLQGVLARAEQECPLYMQQFMGGCMPSDFPDPGELSPAQQEEHLQTLYSAVKRGNERMLQILTDVVRDAGAKPTPEAPHRADGLVYAYEVARLAPFVNEEPVFILGAARSGTSAMAGALRVGAGYFGWGEGHAFAMLPSLLYAVKKIYDFFYIVYDQASPSGFCAFHQLDVYALLHQIAAFYNGIYATAAANNGARRWLDKTPDIEGLRVVPLLGRLYPRGKFIYLHRHPVKFALSHMRKFPWDSAERVIMKWVMSMQTWEAVRKGLTTGTFAEICQADLALQTTKVASTLRELLRLTAEEAKEVELFLRTERPECTSSDADSTELYLEDTNWPAIVKTWCEETWTATALRWGYRLKRAPDKAECETRSA